MNTSNDELFAQLFLAHIADIIVGEGYASFCKDWFEEHNYGLKGCHEAWIETHPRESTWSKSYREAKALLEPTKNIAAQEETPLSNPFMEQDRQEQLKAEKLGFGDVDRSSWIFIKAEAEMRISREKITDEAERYKIYKETKQYYNEYIQQKTQEREGGV